jgi:glycosyltransferase involved in cell wall biosynthesis
MRRGGMNDPVRVLDLIGVDGAGGGAEVIVLRTAARAARYGFRTTVCCIRSANDEAFDVDRRARDLGVDFCEVAEASRFDRRTLPTLRRIARERQIDIVHANGYKSAFYAFRLARTERLVPMATAHGWTEYTWRARFAYYPGERLILRRFARVIAVSGQIRETLIRWGCKPDRVHVLLNGIDADEFHRRPEAAKGVRESLGVGPSDIVLGAVGRLERQKRFDVLLEAVKLLLPKRPNLRLLIAGEGSLKRQLAMQIEQLGIADQCRLLGHCADISQLYQAFDVLVQSSDYEGTPTVVVEAMAMETPVVATEAGGTRELVQDGVHGLIVPLRNPQALAAAIERTLDDRVGTAARVRAARRRVEGDLSFDARMRKLDEIYQEVAQQRREA